MVVLIDRMRAGLKAFARALGQFWEGYYMHAPPGC